ncbi:hypothetical protein NBRC116188_07970 [Oceaniserpentilla sp. 4NH20-0058]|uniref:peroxiredoxin family protein n=1 Tax=Oceaniserpentilla sp. 4NH20-0058 TaxID=3127660 RepID=UPI003108A693
MSIKHLLSILMACVLLSACQEDLLPSNDPLKNTQDLQQGSMIEDFEFTLSDGTTRSLSVELNQYDAVVLYFTMWCPVCDSHMSHIRTDLVSQFSNVKFIFVDYISASIAYTLDAQQANGYTDFDVISDENNILENQFNGTMATTIVIDKNFVVQFKGLYKTTEDLTHILNEAL